jgi:5-hydroxyisourate hydrolase-like protein (transthyretin family)
MNRVTISTHVLHLGSGLPARGVEVHVAGPAGAAASGRTDADGRLRFAAEFDPGTFTLGFNLEGISELHTAATFTVELREGRHYHLPLLVSPYGLTTYRGS